MENYRHTLEIPVRFADLDAMGHLNNAKYLTYIEQARVEYVIQVCGWSGAWSDLGMILAKMTIEFKRPVLYGDKVVVYTRCSRIGSKSFDLEYVLTRQQPESAAQVAATALSVMVAYDYAQQQSIAVPASWRQAISLYEPAFKK